MKERVMMKNVILALMLAGATAPALADDALSSAGNATPLLHRNGLTLAANETPTGDDNALSRAVTAPAQETDADSSWFTPNKVHKYLGLGSLGLVGLALLTTPDSEGDKSKDSGGIHHDFAVGATALGAAAVATGFLYHRKDIDLSKGFKDPDNLHMLFGTLAEVAFIAAVSQAPNSGHAGIGALGAAAMATAITIEW